MRDFITVTALVVSLSGVVVSLAREEVRCYLGLNAESCQVTQPGSPGSNLQEASSGSSEKVRDRKSSDAIQNATEPSLSSPDKSLNESNSDNGLNSLPSRLDTDTSAIPKPPSTATQPIPTPEMPPAHTELKAAPEAISPAPATEQISVSPEQKSNEASAQSSPNIPLKVEPYSPQQSKN